MQSSRTKLFIEAVPLVDRQISGVPHALAGLVAALADHRRIQERFEIVLVAPGSRMHLLDRWPGLERCTRKAIPLKFRIMNGLARRNLLPPMDLLLGKGIYLFGNFFSWSLTSRSRSFTYVHDLCYAMHPELVQPDNQRMLANNMPRFVRQSDFVITVSHSARQEVIDYLHVPPEKIFTLYNGVDGSLYTPYPKKEIDTVRKKYGIGDEKYFLFVGNIEPRKNLRRLIRAFERLPKEYRLCMIGSDGWLNDEVLAAIDKTRAKGHSIIKPRTYVPDSDVARLMSGAVALVQPSIYEGFGMPPLEAMACGTPVVVADIPPLHEVADGLGIYCDPSRVESIAAGLKKAAALTPAERAETARAGQRHAAQFTWSRSAAKLADYLEAAQKEIQRHV